MANLVFIVYLSTHDLEMACVTEPESQGMGIPGNQSLRKEEGSDWENAAGLSSLLTLPERRTSLSTQATAFWGD